MRIIIQGIALALLFIAVVVVMGNDVDLSLDFEQSLLSENGHEEPWKPRAGKVKYVVNKAEKKLSVKFENPTFKLEQADVAKLKSGWMRVRIPAVSADGQVVAGKYLVTSIRGCSLIQDPKEVFSLMTDKTGALMGLQYDRPLTSECDKEKTGAAASKELDITSKIVASLPKEAGTLPQPKVDPETLVQDDGKPKEQPVQQSFLQQYWYLILPSIILYTMLTAPGAPPEQGAAAAAAGGAAAATAAAATGGASDSQVRRRKGGQ